MHQFWIEATTTPILKRRGLAVITWPSMTRPSFGHTGRSLSVERAMLPSCA